MFDVKETDEFRAWRTQLKDARAKGTISSHLDRLAQGHIGDAKPVGDGVSELRVHHGPGYRIYFQRRGNMIIVRLCGGDKNTQAKDIRMARRLAREWDG